MSGGVDSTVEELGRVAARRFIGRVRNGDMVFERLVNTYDRYPGTLEARHAASFTSFLGTETSDVMRLVAEARNAHGRI